MKTDLKYYLLLGIFLLIFQNSFGQRNYVLNFHFTDKSRDLNNIKTDKDYKDSITASTNIKKIYTQIQSLGYVEAQIDSTKWTHKNVHIYINQGKQYLWEEITKGEIDWANLPKLNYRYKDFNLRKFNYQEIIDLEEAIIVSLENSGYPFASVSLSNIKIEDYKIHAQLDINKGKLIHIDTIILSQYKDISLGYIQNCIGIFIGADYNESLLREIDQKLNRLSFAKISKSSEIEFIDNKARIILNLQKHNSNQFDGIIGFQQSNSNGKALLITGQLNLKLDNILKHGESFFVNWESPGNQSQNLVLNLQYPYILDSPFGTAIDFKLNKRDTSFINVLSKPAILFVWNSSNSISTYGNFFTSRALGTTQSETLKNGVLNLNYNAFGIAINLNHLDYPINPLRGFSFMLQADAGQNKNLNYSNLSAEAQDTTYETEYKFTSEMSAQFYVPIGKRNTLLFENQTAIIHSKQLYINELYRIGGFAKLRGFDEQSIFASLYSISTMEYHFLINRNSYIATFYDISYIENDISESVNGIYQSLGLSFSFATQAGIFKLAYAIGKYPNQNFIFRQAKIHFGYTALF